jgi:tetratricopeptide (TPR) repeat protein
MDVFDGRDVRVVARLFDESKDQLVITFTGRAANPPVEKGFGEAFLMKRRISAVHFISKDNHWWQTAEALQGVAKLEQMGLLDGNRRRVLYGSSMGGYAAFILSRVLKPHRIVVFSPQYSIDAKKVPFETRWRNYAAKLKFDHDDMAAGIDRTAEAKAVFDPFFEPDRRHVELFERLRPLERVPISFAGHNTARTLEELGMITSVIDSLLFGTFDIAAFQRSYRNLRIGSSLFWHGLAETAERFGHRATAVIAAAVSAKVVILGGRMKDHSLKGDILRHAIAGACEADRTELADAWIAEMEAIDGKGRIELLRAQVSRAKGNWTETAQYLEEVAPRYRDEPAYALLKAEALIHTKGPAAAMSYYEEVPPLLKRETEFQLIAAKALVAEGRWEPALEALRQIFRRDSKNSVGRMLCARCWAELGRPDVAEKQLAPALHYDLPGDRLVRTMLRQLENGGSVGAATALAARHGRSVALFQSAMSALDKVDWRDRKQVPDQLRKNFSAASSQHGPQKMSA